MVHKEPRTVEFSLRRLQKTIFTPRPLDFLTQAEDAQEAEHRTRVIAAGEDLSLLPLKRLRR
jgi:hypothetical protein